MSSRGGTGWFDWWRESPSTASVAFRMLQVIKPTFSGASEQCFDKLFYLAWVESWTRMRGGCQKTNLAHFIFFAGLGRGDHLQISLSPETGRDKFTYLSNP